MNQELCEQIGHDWIINPLYLISPDLDEPFYMCARCGKTTNEIEKDEQ